MFIVNNTQIHFSNAKNQLEHLIFLERIPELAPWTPTRGIPPIPISKLTRCAVDYPPFC